MEICYSLQDLKHEFSELLPRIYKCAIRGAITGKTASLHRVQLGYHVSNWRCQGINSLFLEFNLKRVNFKIRFNKLAGCTQFKGITFSRSC